MKILLPYDGSRHARRAVEFIAARSPLAGRDPTIWLLNVQPPLLTEVPLNPKAHREKALNCLELVGMADYAHRQISQLSGGQIRPRQ